jgi:hypothetical protein
MALLLGSPILHRPYPRIGVMRALNRHHVREFNPDQEKHWGKRKLKRD